MASPLDSKRFQRSLTVKEKMEIIISAHEGDQSMKNTVKKIAHLVQSVISLLCQKEAVWLTFENRVRVSEERA